MALAFVTSASNGNTSITSITVTGFSVTAGDVVIMFGRAPAGRTWTPAADGLSTTYNLITSQLYDTADSNELKAYVGRVSSTGTCTPGFSVDGAGTRLGVSVQVWSGSDRSTAADFSSARNDTGTSSAADGGTCDSTQNAIFAAFVGTASTAGASAGTGYANLTESVPGRCASESKSVTGATNDNGDFTITAQKWGAITVVVHENAGSTAVPVFYHNLRQQGIA